eukprot:SAG11_NODE_872_length_6802_cov_8.951514_12_plen_144_part_00
MICLQARAKVIGLLSTLFGSSSTIWSTVLNGCVGGSARYAAKAFAATVPAAALPASLTIGIPSTSSALVIEELLQGASLGSGSGGAAPSGSLTHEYTCLGGWINGDLRAYFLLLAIALPSLTVLGASVSFRITSAEERDRADW